MSSHLQKMDDPRAWVNSQTRLDNFCSSLLGQGEPISRRLPAPCELVMFFHIISLPHPPIDFTASASICNNFCLCRLSTKTIIWALVQTPACSCPRLPKPFKIIGSLILATKRRIIDSRRLQANKLFLPISYYILSAVKNRALCHPFSSQSTFSLYPFLDQKQN